MIEKGITKVISLLAIFVLVACSLSPEEISTEQRTSVFTNRHGAFFALNRDFNVSPLNVYETMALGIQNNLDKRMAELESKQSKGLVLLEALTALPTLEARAEYLGRDSNRATSSISAITNTQSLEPSFSTDEHRRVAGLDFAYNTLDLGLGYINAQQAKGQAGVAQQRLRKVIHDIMQDIRRAHWRVVVLQDLESQKKDLFVQARESLKIIDETERRGLRLPTRTLAQKKRLHDLMQDLQQIYSDLSLARFELAGLIGLHPDTVFKVAETLDGLYTNQPFSEPDNETLITIALFSRPEIIEQLHLQNISKADLQKTVFESFPVLGGLVGGDYDENSFQQEPNLTNFSLSLSLELVQLLTLPARYNQKKKEINLEKERLKALTAAIMTQVFVAKQRLRTSKETLDLSRQNYHFSYRLVEEVKKEIQAELSAEVDLVESDLQKTISKMRFANSFIDYQNSFGQLINSTGLDIAPQGFEKMEVDILAKEIKSSFDSLNKNKFIEIANYQLDTLGQSHE